MDEPPSILVVEDDQIIAWDLTERLTGLGYRVAAHAASGSEAVRLAADLRPDLIVMDVRLGGGIDGIEAARLILAERPTRLLFLTGQADAATVSRTRLIGAPGYLLKPYSDDDLRRGIQACLEQPPAAAPVAGPSGQT